LKHQPVLLALGLTAGCALKGDVRRVELQVEALRVERAHADSQRAAEIDTVRGLLRAVQEKLAAQQAYLVGFVATGEVDETSLAPDEDAEALLRPDVAAVTDLLVEPRWGRRGHGSRLLAASAEMWRTDGFSTAVAWSFEADTAMRAFLISAGWELDGASRALDVDDLLVPQVRLHTAVG